MNLPKQVYQTIRQQHMIDPGDTVVLGVSGGADSVCLLLLLSDLRQELSFRLQAVHVEHGIRGEEALEDARFTKTLCDKLSVPCRIVSVDVPALARKEHLSEEEAGRKARYEAFLKEAANVSASGASVKIALAHHSKDQAETVLMNLARGTGLRGMGGIRPVNGRLIRPLLYTSREEIETFLGERAQDWRTDSTNNTTDYTRNRVRSQILPLLSEAVNERAAEHIARCAKDVAEAYAFIDKLARERMKAMTGMLDEPVKPWLMGTSGAEDGQPLSMDASTLLAEDPVLQKAICRQILTAFYPGTEGQTGLKDLGAIHVDKLLDLASGPEGRCADLPGALRVVKEAGRLVFYPAWYRSIDNDMNRKNCGAGTFADTWMNIDMGSDAAADEMVIDHDGHYSFGGCELEIRFEEREQGSAVESRLTARNEYTKWLAYDTMEDTLKLRKRLPGDYLVVGKEGGRKKLKNYLIDEKVPSSKRDGLVLLAQGSHVLWVPGMRISEAAKIRENTKYMVRVERTK